MKRFAAVTLVLTLLICLSTALAGSPGTSSDPLISKSYVDGTYTNEVVAEGEKAIEEALGAVYDNAVSKLTGTSSGNTSGYSLAEKFTEVSLNANTKINMVTGSSFILNTGSAVINISEGKVVNVSTGKTVPTNTALVQNERYFCVEDTQAQIIAASAVRGYVDGYYAVEEDTGVAMNFTDVATTDWFYSAVEFTYAEGFFTGTSDTTFSPYGATNRAMIIAILYRMDGSPAVSGSSTFTDVSSSDYYYNALLWATQNEIAQGYDDGKFHPYDSITREQMATFIARYAAYLGHDITAASSTTFDSFPDKGQVSSYAVDAMKWVTANGIINGSDGLLSPYSTAIRAQAAQILYNFCMNILEM